MYTRKLLLILGLLICGLIAGRPAAALAATDEAVLARVGDKTLIRADLEQYLQLFRHAGTYEQCSFAARRRHLKNLINRCLLLEEARRQGYFADPDLKKHAHLDQGETETFVLRQFLNDRVSRPGSASPEQIKSYQGEHPGMNSSSAEEELNRELRMKIFNELIDRLRKQQTIIVYEDRLR